MADRYWILGTGTWNSTSTTNWSASSGGAGGASVPTAADNVFFDANSNVLATAFTVTMDNLPRVCNDFTASGLDGAMTLTQTGGATTLTVSGSLTFPATNFNRLYSGRTTFNATTTNKTITTNGVSLAQVIISGVGGKWTLGSALTGAGIFFLTNGTVDLNGQTLTVASFQTSTGTKNLTFNGGTLACTPATTTSFNNAAPTGFTTTAGTGTGTISMTAATAKTFVGGGSTFNCTLNQGGAGALTITGSNTFSNITNTRKSVSASSILFTAGTTNTFTDWTASGESTRLLTIGSDIAASHTLSKSSGTVSADFLSISRSTATGGAGWYAGANSTDGGNNTGWIFTAPPAVIANVTGVEATGAVGTVTGSGDASTEVIGVQATGEVGIVTASGGVVVNGDAYPTGVFATGNVGTITANGAASTDITGVSSTASAGITIASGDASTTVIGAESIGQVGTLTVNGNGQTNLIGVQATAEAGIVTATGGLIAALPNGGIGYPFIIEPDRVYPPRHAIVNVKSAYARGSVSKIFANGTGTKNSNQSVQTIFDEIMLDLLTEQKTPNPTDEELVALLFMD